MCSIRTGSTEKHTYYIYEKAQLEVPVLKKNFTIKGREGYDEVDEEVACSQFFLNAVRELTEDGAGETIK